MVGPCYCDLDASACVAGLGVYSRQRERRATVCFVFERSASCGLDVYSLKRSVDAYSNL